MFHEVFPINSETDPKLIRLLKRHTYQNESLMNDRLFELFRDKHEMWPQAAYNGHAILLYDDYGKFVGWSLCFQMDVGFKNTPTWYLYMWIKVRERRRGYGRMLMLRSKQEMNVSKFVTESHDRVASSFFTSVN